MTEEDLMTRLLSDLATIGLPVYEVDVVFRPYSKTYYGRYFPVRDERKMKPKIHLYPYELSGDFMDYTKLFENGVHEFIHHIQYSDRSFVRKKGVMHDVQFWKLYNHYMNRAYRYEIVEKRGDSVEQQRYATV